MRTPITPGRLFVPATILAVVLALSVVGTAQRQGGAAAQGRGNAPAATAATVPIRVAVTITEVKSDMIGVFDDLIKNEAIPALKKAGVAYRWTWANFISGPNNLRISVQPIVNMAQYDEPSSLQKSLGAAGAAAYNAKLRTAIVSARTKILTLQRNLSIISNATAPPTQVQVQVIQAVPGKGQELLNIMAADYIPNYKKLGVKDYWVYTTTFGGPQGELTIVRPLEKFAEIDKGPLLTQAVGADAAAQINARRNPLMAGSEITFERLLPDLSFGLPARLSN